MKEEDWDSEEWADIKDFPKHMISNHGRVCNWESGVILRPRPSGWGYLQVMLWRDGKAHTKTVHLMVAHAFLPGWDTQLEPNHIDGNKLNNHEDNLEWVTKRMNNQHAIDTGLRKPRRTPVECIDTGEVFPSVVACAEKFNLWPTSIVAVCRGKLKTTGGYRFRYVSVS